MFYFKIHLTVHVRTRIKNCNHFPGIAINSQELQSTPRNSNQLPGIVAQFPITYLHYIMRTNTQDLLTISVPSKTSTPPTEV